MINVKLIIYL